ncbi:outer membrane protein assembly factor BamD [Mariprofundus micogutta]|uniref:Outer membrane protein assembly factor BamD n=1 Tax=Mariprofundus micogutta TaxID=1921010 RepID=A0A1L8CKB7_9PROT|nr:outer membrane protein assembly factor BamD [Mariprofundus micogutta]GAV19368.1 outer membrane protein assembly factor BamD [Mariprofundus micogutta]
MNRISLRFTSLLLLLLMVSACAKDELAPGAGAKDEYADAKRLLGKGEYGTVAMRLDKFSSKYPYSKYTTKAELLRVFAAYKNKEYILSETLATTFIARHPKHRNVDYAKYMLAMTHLRQTGSPSTDTTQTKNAIKIFNQLLNEHPNSDYASRGKKHLQKLYTTLAKHELEVGKYYFDEDLYVAAANRFQTVVEKYQTTSAIEEALYLLAASYAEMGLSKDASQTARLLRHNYPNSSWSDKASSFR